jgi:nucleoside-diphosphate-sugar epimerase
MYKILVLGATGFIGKNVVKTFLSFNKHEIIAHSRVDSAYNSDEFISSLQGVDIIINCTGIGLSKLYRTTATNKALTRDICNAIAAGNSKAIIFHLSTIKAYNPLVVIDPYALDKSRTEAVFQEFDLLKRTCILRIPIITGLSDPNFTPFIALLKKFCLPLVKDTLPKLNIISAYSLSYTIHNMIDRCPEYLGQIIYILNNKNITWNELVKGVGKPSIALSIGSMRLLWSILSIQNYFIKDRVPFPKERFNDLFMHEWAIEKSYSSIILNDDIINLLRTIDD